MLRLPSSNRAVATTEPVAPGAETTLRSVALTFVASHD